MRIMHRMVLGLLAGCWSPAIAAPPAPLISGQTYTLTSKTSGLLLDNEASLGVGNPVWQWESSGGNTNQQWQINSLGNGYYGLIDQTSGMALDSGPSQDEGTPVIQSLVTSGTTSQEWQIEYVGGGYYRLVSASSGKALDNSGSTVNGGPVRQWDIGAGNPNQMWRISPVQIGAATPFTSYEAENGSLGGQATVVSLTSPPETEFSSPELEASGHAFVHLSSTGDSVSLTNNTGKNITAVNVRYSIPDAPTGGGIVSTIDLYVNGVFNQALRVNSKQTWEYESAGDYDGFSKDPAVGYPHVFWDEAHVFLKGGALANGSTITLQKDAANSAQYYNIDVIDLEKPAPALSQPTNSLSIVSCGAVPNRKSFDSTGAIQNCINQAEAQGKTVWIPRGTFYLNTPAGLTATGTTIGGAGMWYSVIYYNPPLPAASTNNVILPTSTSLMNFAIDESAIGAGPGQGNGGPVNIKGNNWIVDGLWIQHGGAGIWADGTNGIVQNSRINNSWADGINLNNGNGGPGNNIGSNLVARNNFIRGSGDDGLAINDGSGGEEMSNITLLDNTVVAPWWANCIGIYGGTYDLVANNSVADPVREYGISIGLFGGQAYLAAAKVQGNVVIRGGNRGYGNYYPGVGVGVSGTVTTISDITVAGNRILNAMFDGMDVGTGTGLTLVNNTVESPGLTAFAITPNSQGSASFIDDTALLLQPGQLPYTNTGSSGFSVTGSGNVGFNVP